MLNKNKIELRGRLGANPTCRSTNTGKRVANLSIATVESWKDKGGDWQEKTQWHRCEAWGPLVDIIEKHGLKGDLVEVEAKIEYRQNERDGIKYNDAIMVLNTFQRLDRPKPKEEAPAAEPKSAARSSKSRKPAPAPQSFEYDDEIPF